MVGEAIVDGDCSAGGFIWKKAIVISNTAIHIRSRPMIIIVRNAPIISNRDAVENKPTPVFVESIFSERLAKIAQTMMVIQIITNTASTPPTIGPISLRDRFEVLGVMLESDEIVDQLPFQDG